MHNFRPWDNESSLTEDVSIIIIIILILMFNRNPVGNVVLWQVQMYEHITYDGCRINITKTTNL